MSEHEAPRFIGDFSPARVLIVPSLDDLGGDCFHPATLYDRGAAGK